MSDETKGGSYTVNDKGERTLAEAPTRDHPEGNAPRPATDTAPEPKPATAKTATGPAAARGPRPDPGAETKRS